jgi:DNA invertase Pin-like site-specific DNA recombinase
MHIMCMNYGDTPSDFAELGAHPLRVAAKLERRRRIERTARGRADANGIGVVFGRKTKLTPHQQGRHASGSMPASVFCGK